ncbi:hypothetical protein ACI2KR_06660 [Pseudomonas luteola]
MNIIVTVLVAFFYALFIIYKCTFGLLFEGKRKPRRVQHVSVGYSDSIDYTSVTYEGWKNSAISE